MKISDIKAVALNIPLKQASKAGTYKIERRGTIITTITTSDGAIGQTYIGQTRTKISEQKTTCEIINGMFKKSLLGEDPLMIQRLWRKMYKHIEDYSPYDRAKRDLILESIACVDVSLYDLIGKILGLPVYKLLGGSRDCVPLVQVQYYQKRDEFSEQIEELRKATSKAKRYGFRGIKLKVGALPIEQDLERVKAVREEGGDDFVICTDANHAWTAEEAINFGKQAEDQSISYIEQPVKLYDEKRDLKKVREALSIPISACQSFKTRIEIMEYVTYGSVNLINPDILKVGGITEWIKIANIADYYSVKMTACANIETTIPLFGGVTNTTWVTQQTPEREPFWSGGMLVKNTSKPKRGCLKLPNVPGIGYEIKEEAIEKLRVMNL